MTGFEELKARQSSVWGSAPWERAAPLLADVHRHLVRRLDPKPGERWLDVATGTGAVALVAAAAGASVSGLDLAPRLIETARRLAGEAGLAVEFSVGDAEALPYDDASFDVVSSSMGAIFAPDHGAVARELARVCRPGGRIGITAWRPDSGFSPVTRRYSPPLPDGAGESEDWGRDDYARALLGDAFDLELEEGHAFFRAESGEDAWELCRTSVGPFKAMVEELEPDRRDELHAEFVEFLERHRADGGVRLPAPYVLILGHRR